MTRLVRFSNNAVSRLAANITNASTTISLTPGDGAKFPVISGTQFFMATLIKSTGETEIVKVTARATDTLTVVRAAEPVGATQVAYAFSAGDRIEQRLTAKAISDELDRLDSGANIGATNKTANYTVQAADVSTLIRVDTTAGATTITLPEIATLADDFDIMVAKVTDNANAVNIVRSGSTDLINGATSYPVNSQWQSAWLIADRSTNTWTAINSGAATSSIAVDTFTGDGTAGPYTLSGDPMSKANTAVYLSGVYQQKATYTLAGTSLTMGGNVPVGVMVEVVWSRPLSIGRTDSDLVTYDSGTVQDVLDGAKSLQDYAALRAYTGRAKRIYITGPLGTAKPAGIAGVFQYDSSDTTSADNGGTIIVGADGRRWKRDFSGNASVAWFGANGGGSDETLKIQAAFNYMKATGTTLEFEAGKTYLVSQVSIASAGGNTRANFRIRGNGALLQGSGASSTFRTYRCQGMNIHGLRVAKHASATYATELDSFWFGNFVECSFGETKLHADSGWGFYWNEFNGCSHTSLHFDLTDYTINHNLWNGGQVGSITKTNAGHPTFKEAYNNVFSGVDLLGPIDWRDASSSFHDPLILRDCNMEYTGVNHGYIIATGGRSNPVDVANTQLFPWDDLRSEYDQQYSGSSWSTGWMPGSSANLIRGGACQRISPDISMIAVANTALSTYADANSPTGNGYCYRAYFAGTSAARIRIRMPVEYLAAAKKVGFVSFSWWEYSTLGGEIVIVNQYGTPGTGDQYPSGLAIPTGASSAWVQRFLTVPVNSAATDISLHIGGANVAGFDVRIANVSCVLGKVARPYSPAQGEPHAKRGLVFTKNNLIQDGTAQNTFSLTIPATASGRVRITATTNSSNSGGIYSGELVYSSYSGTSTAASITPAGVAGAGFGGTAGTITLMSVSASGTTLTVTTTVATYGGTPTISGTYVLEFLDNNETVTWL